MFKAIKITPANAKAIEAALAAVNGRATQHVFKRMSEIEWLAASAERKLDALKVPKFMRAGAEWVETSGAEVSSAYAKKNSTRKATTVQIARKSSAWYVTRILAGEVYKEGGGPGRLILTKEQAAKAVAEFSKQFAVAA
jgi:hypothetical protein